MARLPWFQFYPADWFRDTRCLSLAARGAWADMLGILWDSKTRGVKTHDMKGWASEIGKTVSEFRSVLTELDERKVANIKRSPDGFITVMSRRMRREERVRESGRERQARLRDNGGGDPLRWASIRIRILERDSYQCRYCSRRARTVDHVLPKSRGGTESDDNLVACCKKCNQCKTNKTLEECGFTLLNVTDPSLGHNTDITAQKAEVISQKAEIREEKIKTPLRAQRLHDLESFEVDTEMREWAMKEFGVSIPPETVIEFKDFWRGKRQLRTDWKSTFQGRIRQLVGWKALTPANGSIARRPPPPPAKTDPIARGQWKQAYGDPRAYGYE